MTAKQPKPALFWGSFAVMLAAVLAVAFTLGVAAQQWTVAFFVQVLLAALWVAFFWGYRPARWRSTDRA